MPWLMHGCKHSDSQWRACVWEQRIRQILTMQISIIFSLPPSLLLVLTLRCCLNLFTWTSNPLPSRLCCGHRGLLLPLRIFQKLSHFDFCSAKILFPIVLPSAFLSLVICFFSGYYYTGDFGDWEGEISACSSWLLPKDQVFQWWQCL